MKRNLFLQKSKKFRQMSYRALFNTTKSVLVDARPTAKGDPNDTDIGAVSMVGSGRLIAG